MTQQLITKIKKKIEEIKQLIINHEKKIASGKNTLLTLIQELNNLELNMKNNQISPQGSNINSK